MIITKKKEKRINLIWNDQWDTQAQNITNKQTN